MAEADATLRGLREALEQRRAEGRQPALLRAYADLGRAYLAADRVDEAESALRTAIAQARIWGDPVELGLPLIDLGRAQCSLERRDRALLAFTEAAGCLSDRHAEGHAAASVELRALGRVPGGAR